MVLSAVGAMGEAVVLGWLTLELTDSPLLVGVAMGARGLPLFFVGVPAGALADRFPRRRLLLLTSGGQVLTNAALGALALTGLVSLTWLLVLTVAAGAVRGVEWAARQSYAHDIAGSGALVSALAIVGIAMRAGWLFGSLGAGVAVARYGSGAAYLAVAASHLAAGVALLPASEAAAGGEPPARASVWTNVAGFVAAARADRVLPVLMLLTAGAEILGFSHQTLLPSLARDVLDVGPEGLGALNAARAVGGILGLVAVSARAGSRGGGLFLGVLLAFGASLVGLGLAPRVVAFAGVLAVLVLVNALGALSDLLSQSLMQLGVPGHLRGRAGGAWVVAIGLAPLGNLQIGALASAFGVGVALGASGLALTALAAAAALLFPRVRRL